MVDKATLAERFKRFATAECMGSSELYYFLALKISEDDELLDLCIEAKACQPVPNLLLGGVHYLLLEGHTHPLQDFYPSLTPTPKDIKKSFVAFKSFCQIYRDEVRELLKTKLVQTNEVNRCAYLYPIFCYIFEQVKRPLSLIEIGTSSGLHLLWDEYSYSYGTHDLYGKSESPVTLTSELRGGQIPLILENSPPVLSRTGLDLHINDLRKAEDALWLKALIWPEHHERRKLFEKASDLFRRKNIELLEGDGIALLEQVVEKLPLDAPVCVFHTHVANQFSNDQKQTLLEKIRTIGSRRDVFHIYNNMWDRNLHLDSYINGTESSQVVGESEGHGRWFEWRLS
ncbi:MAG TPA: DUF2332 domain-containing protein [Candidatus Angelobacter sp.]|nr:DUF2332 domain-containing protein [Candidatus Angelobacter sp.]